MNEHAVSSVVGIALAVTGLAIIAIIVSKGANTSAVTTAGGGAIKQLICVATSPVTGASCPKSLLDNVTSTISFGTP